MESIERRLAREYYESIERTGKPPEMFRLTFHEAVQFGADFVIGMGEKIQPVNIFGGKFMGVPIVEKGNGTTFVT